MDLNWQIDIVNQMIRKDPESTIRDYLDVLAEIKTIKPEEDMNKPVLYTAEQAEFMIKNCQEWTAKQLADGLGIPESTVRNFGTRYKLTFRKSPAPKPAPKAKTVMAEETRPAANYSNTGFISVTKKYAS